MGIERIFRFTYDDTLRHFGLSSRICRRLRIHTMRLQPLYRLALGRSVLMVSRCGALLNALSRSTFDTFNHI